MEGPRSPNNHVRFSNRDQGLPPQQESDLAAGSPEHGASIFPTESTTRFLPVLEESTDTHTPSSSSLFSRQVSSGSSDSSSDFPHLTGQSYRAKLVLTREQESSPLTNPITPDDFEGIQGLPMGDSSLTGLSQESMSALPPVLDPLEDLKNLNEQLLKQQDNLNAKDDTITALRAALSGKEVELVRLSEEVQNFNSRISTLEQDRNTAHAQHQSEIETYKTQVESLQQQHNEDNLKITEMQGQIAHCENEIKELKGVERAQKQLLSEQQQQITEINQLEQALKNKNDEIVSLQQQHNEDNLKITEMQGQIALCADEIKELKGVERAQKQLLSEQQQQITEINQLEQALKNKNDEIVSLQQQHNEDNLKITEMQGQIAHCENEIKELKGVDREQKQLLSEQQQITEINQLEQALKNKNDEIVSLKTQIEPLTEDLSKANENLQKHKDLNTSLLIEINKTHHSLMQKNAMLLSMIGNEPASTDAATQQQPQQAQPMGDASEQPVGRPGRERTASSGSRDEPPSSDQEPALFPGTPDSHTQLGVSTAQSPPSATVQSSSGSISEMDNIIEVPRNITQIFENARKMGIPAKYVYLGYDLINDGDDVPAKITSLDDLEAADQADETVLYEIAQTYGGENNAVKTPMQELSIETVWANACQLELFLCVRGVKHWMALPHKEFCKKLSAVESILAQPRKGNTLQSSGLTPAELRSIKEWIKDKKNYQEKTLGGGAFSPLQWLTTLALEVRKNSHDHLTQLIACWADFSIQVGCKDCSAIEKNKYQQNPDPFNWRRLGEDASTEMETGDSSQPGPSGQSSQLNTPHKRLGKRHQPSSPTSQKMHKKPLSMLKRKKHKKNK